MVLWSSLPLSVRFTRSDTIRSRKAPSAAGLRMSGPASPDSHASKLSAADRAAIPSRLDAELCD